MATEREIIHAENAAAELLSRVALKDVLFGVMRRDLTDELIVSMPSEHDKREDLYRSINRLNDLESRLTLMAENADERRKDNV